MVPDALTERIQGDGGTPGNPSHRDLLDYYRHMVTGIMMPAIDPTSNPWLQIYFPPGLGEPSTPSQLALRHALMSKRLLKLTVESNNKVTEIVQGVVRDIRAKGGKAVRTYSGKFDNWPPASFKLSDSQIRDCINQVPLQTIEDIKTAQENVRKFAEVQRASTHICTYDHFRSQSRRGEASHCLHATHPRETPKFHYRRCSFVGADEIFVIGGTQAIAAMAIGTETIKKVDFIAGPENAFVAETKRLLFGETGIDLFAGPTEVFIVADEAADLFTVATGMLSQAEYWPDTPEVLITTSEKMEPETIKIINKLLETLPTSELAGTS
ncbi:Histidinol dehydrogenase [Fusarium keratoplasticum]|nr:Histidinol dehydrogenase [Fusarium keratoplasticum]